MVPSAGPCVPSFLQEHNSISVWWLTVAAQIALIQAEGWEDQNAVFIYLYIFLELFIVNTISVFNYLSFFFYLIFVQRQHIFPEVTLSLVWNDSLDGARKFQPHMPTFFPIWSRNPMKESNRKEMIRKRCFKRVQETGQETLFLSSRWLLKARGSHDLPGTQVLWSSFLLRTAHSHLQPRWRHSLAASVCRRWCFTRFRLQA